MTKKKKLPTLSRRLPTPDTHSEGHEQWFRWIEWTTIYSWYALVWQSLKSEIDGSDG
jgi:hypothetical protein